jgi:hypothetical protein
VPWFLVGFLVVAAVNSLGVIAPGPSAFLVQASIFLIAVALAAIGLSTDAAALRRAGWRPLLLGALLWVLVATTLLLVILGHRRPALITRLDREKRCAPSLGATGHSRPGSARTQQAGGRASRRTGSDANGSLKTSDFTQCAISPHTRPSRTSRMA